LIATAAGLTIAIMTLPVYNYLTERVKEIVADMEVRATQLLNILASLRGTGATLSEGTLREAAAS
jgi:biopolymer transport protein ExbB/TolQ